jgi:hypothetical protein
VEWIGAYPVPAGPLAVRWLAWELGEAHAGSLVRARVALENAGSAAWRSPAEDEGIKLSYHWLDERGNPIVWDGARTPLELEPGTSAELAVELRAPIPPGRYRIAFDLVEEGRFWLAELGNTPLEREVEVRPRDAAGARDYLAGAEPADDRAERVRAAHEEGYAAVGGALEVAPAGLRRRPPPELAPYAPDGGRKPGFPHPLLCPSLLPPLEPNVEIAGLPAWRPEGDEPWLYDARIRARLPAGRRRG